MDLQKLREKVSGIDRSIVECLVKRFEIVTKIGIYKAANGLPLYDGIRENEIFRMIQNSSNNPEVVSSITGIYNKILEHSKNIQRENHDNNN